MKSFLVFLFVLPCVSFAAPKFHCYSLPNRPVQAFEYTSAECMKYEAKDKKASKAKIGENDEESEDGMKDIICAYEAGCKVVSDEDPSEPTGDMSATDLQLEVTSGNLKGSFLLCKGRGAVDSNGVISDAQCPTPTRCQRDLLYNFGSRSLSPSDPKKATVDKGAK